MPVYAKALVSLISTALAQLAVVLVGPTANLSDLTDGQWVTVAAASLAAAAAVYGIRNGVSSDPTTSTPERDPQAGYGAVELLVVVILVVLLIFLVLRLA